MAKRVVPMIHVPDVAATVDWYRDIAGFTVVETYGHEGPGFSFAVMAFGETRVMFNQGGHASTQRRREVDLYVYVEEVDQIYERLKGRVDVVEGPHDKFYGMRELIIRDPNRFWITFGQPTAYGMLMHAIRAGSLEGVSDALNWGTLKPEELTNALVSVTDEEKPNEEIVPHLKQAGAETPPQIKAEVLQAHVGKYNSDGGMEANIRLSDGHLIAEPGGQGCLRLIPIDESTFRPLIFSGVTVQFNVEVGKTVGFVLQDGTRTTRFKRVTEERQTLAE